MSDEPQYFDEIYPNWRTSPVYDLPEEALDTLIEIIDDLHVKMLRFCIDNHIPFDDDAIAWLDVACSVSEKAGGYS